MSLLSSDDVARLLLAVAVLLGAARLLWAGWRGGRTSLRCWVSCWQGCYWVRLRSDVQRLAQRRTSSPNPGRRPMLSTGFRT